MLLKGTVQTEFTVDNEKGTIRILGHFQSYKRVAKIRSLRPGPGRQGDPGLLDPPPLLLDRPSFPDVGETHFGSVPHCSRVL